MAITFDEFGNEIETGIADEMIAEQDAAFDAMGGMDDDQGPSDMFGDAPTQEELEAWAQTPDYKVMTDVSATNSGTTISGKSDTTSANKSQKAGKRLKNPLGNFSSYTYQLTLYMITPDVYNQFVISGRKNLSSLLTSKQGGVFIVAQSGGINNKNSTRAPGFKLDYYIDNLVIESSAGGKDTGGAFNATDLSFTIYEPYGFSLIKNLKTAMDQIQSYSSLKNIDKMENASRNFFMLGLRFLGYDAEGNAFAGNSSNLNLNGTSSANTSTFERFYDIIISEIAFKIDGRMTTYNCKAKNVGTQAGYGVKFGRLRNDVTAVASTVSEALNGNSNLASGLLSQLNTQQKDMADAKKIEIPNQYDIIFIGPEGELISSSSVLNKKADSDKTKMPAAAIKTSEQVTEKSSINSKPNNNYRNLVFKADTSVLQCIQLIISQSSYIEDAIKQLYTTKVEPDPVSDKPSEVINNSKRTLRYYNVSSQVEILGYDTRVNDFAYKITYVVEPYNIPVLQAVGANLTEPYYGPAKRYEYWFTGENTEILRFEQSYNNLYMLVAVGSEKNSSATSGSSATPIVADRRQNSPRQGKTGIGAEAQNAITNFLTDPASQAEAKVTILGDPDFLIYPNSNTYNPNYDPFYDSDGFTINPNGGQVFIEIDFKEAVDYDNTKGVMTVNDKIMFFEYPKSIRDKVKGVVYLVTKVKSEFKSGKFEQTLDLKMIPFTEKEGQQSSAASEPGTSPDGARTAEQNAEPETIENENTVGLVEEPTSTLEGTSVSEGLENFEIPDNGFQITSPTELDVVADDDAVSFYNSELVYDSSVTIPDDEIREI